MRARWVGAVATACCVVASACAGSPGVMTESAAQSVDPAGSVNPPSTPPSSPTPPSTGTPSTTGPPDPTDPPVTAPPATVPPATDPAPPATAPPALGELLNLGDAKSPRSYDDFVRAALADIQLWWSEQYPVVYDDPFTPLSGGVYVAYPERTDPIPGCGDAQETTYDEISQYAAFYCMQGDFMVYDDGVDGVLYALADQLGPSVLGVVLAHEYGHAIQARTGDLDRGLPTITTEQQADCFAGAWVARAVRGEAVGVSYSDEDVRNGLVAMITVRDPIGIDQFAEGGHGSAFDRVGAFQVGYAFGPQECSELIADPLPLVPNVFRRQPSNVEGNSPYGYGDDQIVAIIATDLNDYWPTELAASGVSLGPLTVVPVQSADEIACDDVVGDFAVGAAYCPDSQQVFLNEPLALDLYDKFGDFAVGYALGYVWSEAAQRALSSPLQGEARALLDDCLTGAWVADIIPDANGETLRGSAVVEPGDLDEAIQTALVVGDESSTENVRGSGFEKIASFREGVLEGIDVCTSRLGD